MRCHQWFGIALFFAMQVDSAAAAVLAADDRYAVSMGGTLTIDVPGVLANDDPAPGGTRTVAIAATVTHGAVSLSPNGSFTYTPASGFVGIDAFTYRTTSGTDVSNEATVTIVVSPAGTPLPPYHLAASEIRGNRVTLTWSEPPPFGAAVLGYVVEAGLAPDAVAGTLSAGRPPFSLDLPSGRFFVRVRTLSILSPRPLLTRTSDPSNEIELLVSQPVPPAAPQTLLATVNGDSLSLVWRNAYTAGEPTGLVLDVSGSLSASVPLSLREAATFAGVPAGSYSLRLRATNAAGSSAASNTVAVVLPGPCSGAPQPPTRVQAHQTLGTISISWDAPTAGPAPTGYVVNVSGAFTGSFPTSGRSLSGRAGAGTYVLTVVATNPCGSSAPTAPAEVTVVQ